MGSVWGVGFERLLLTQRSDEPVSKSLWGKVSVFGYDRGYGRWDAQHELLARSTDLDRAQVFGVMLNVLSLDLAPGALRVLLHEHVLLHRRLPADETAHGLEFALVLGLGTAEEGPLLGRTDAIYSLLGECLHA